MKLIKLIIYLFSVFALTSCAISVLDEPKIGMKFSSDIWADKTETGKSTGDNNNFYQYIINTNFRYYNGRNG
jgi:hypothetical protein